MTAVPPPVPPEIVRRAAEALEDATMRWLGRDLGTIHRDDIAAEGIAAVYGDIVEAAQRESAAEIERLRWAASWAELSDERVALIDSAMRESRFEDLLGEAEAERDRAVRDARRDALDQAVEAIEADAHKVEGMRRAARIVAGLRDSEATG